MAREVGVEVHIQHSKKAYTTALDHLEHRFFGFDMVLPMNTGAEAVETGIKIARKWGYKVKGIPENQAIVLSVTNNFHGRTVGLPLQRVCGLDRH